MSRITVVSGEQQRTIASREGMTILEALRAAGFTGPDAPCGGNGKCKKCTVAVSGMVCPPEGGETHRAENEMLLACRWSAAGECIVVLPQIRQLTVLTHGAQAIEGGGQGLGLAIDIGTTTLALFLYDLADGSCLGCTGERNAQRVYGADVISRITCCTQGQRVELTDTIRTQITDLAGCLCSEAGYTASEISVVSVAANTVMEHLLLGLDPSGIGVAPFTPESLFGECVPASGCFECFAPDACLYPAPALAGYVGGDITAGLLAAGADRADGLWLYMDIGTNGEMGLGDQNGFVCCATAAGPAFEGADIDCGMAGAPGAIDRVTFRDGKIEFHVIGGGEPVGICGSGLIDAVAALIAGGVITESGRMVDPEEAPEPLRPQICEDMKGQMRFCFTDQVYLSARDVRQFQLAKAAIRAGAETLLEQAGKTPDDLSALVIAGGFGNFMDKQSALAVGLLPPMDSGRIRYVGNAAGAGAALALTAAGRMQLQTFCEKCSYVELSGSPVFMEKYVECMAFENAVEE